MSARARRACGRCGRVVALRHAAGGSNKARVRHRCPHGTWCVAGTLNGTNANHPTCLGCKRACCDHCRRVAAGAS